MDCGLTGDMQFFDGSSWRSMNMGAGLTPVFPPVVLTSGISNISTTGAVCGGNVTDTGSSNVISRGVCWSTLPAPTIGLETKTWDGKGKGNFSSNMSGLIPDTKYYVRAYAVNNLLTAYGNQVEFSTAPVLLPVVTTEQVIASSYDVASSGGLVSNDGGAIVTARGICWSTSSNPTVALSTKTSDSSGTGSFSSLMTGLLSSTTYYVRAYATNSAGTAYGIERSFTTIDVNAASLPSVTIGSQIWMNKNLDTIQYRNGDTIPQVTDAAQWFNLTSGAWCWYNNDSATYAAKYGKLYNWYAVADPRGLCPVGWHVPSIDEWNVLTTFLGDDYLAGPALMTVASWGSDNDSQTPNSSGFTGHLGGGRSNSNFEAIDFYGYWWTTAELNSNNSTAFRLSGFDAGYGNIDRYPFSKKDGFSVRCLNDKFLPAQLPAIKSYKVKINSVSNAASGGRISTDGGKPVTARGVCWSTSPNPDITLSTKTADGSGIGAFSSSITGLLPNTTYYLRAYASNAVGTSYGEEQVFTTVDSNFKVLPIVKLGTQTWMATNLNVSTYSNGDPIPQVTGSYEWGGTTEGAWCWFNNDCAAYAAKYGRLYNWYVVNDPRGICPSGWHVPGDAEWMALADYLGGASVAGGAMKNLTGWGFPNSGATNSSQFSGVANVNREILNDGSRTLYGYFQENDMSSSWWSYVNGNTSAARLYYLSTLSIKLVSNSFSNSRELKGGHAVRCIKN